MTTITLELTDEQAKLLAEEAKRLSLPIQEVAARRLFAGWQPTNDKGSSMEFEEAMEYVFHKNSELYRRLA